MKIICCKPGRILICSLLSMPAVLFSYVNLDRLCNDLSRHHVETITKREHSYLLRMGGKIDGEMTRDPLGYWAYDQYWEANRYVRLENIGSTAIVNPWLRRADRPDTRSLASIVDFVVKPVMSEAEKARALWEFEIKQRFHATTATDMGKGNEVNYELNDVIKRFNCYGYTLCQNESVVMSDLWRAAGLKVRSGWPNQHSTAEVFYDEAWHLLDSDESIICLMRDNRTIAGEEDIVADHDLMKRTHTYGVLHDQSNGRDVSSAALHYYEGERSGEKKSFTCHKMDFVLRPGEAITWVWERGNKYHGSEDMLWNKRWRLYAHVMNGSLDYSPDLSDPSIADYLELNGVEQCLEGPFGPGLYAIMNSACVVVPVSSAYPVVGGRLEVDFNRSDQYSEKVEVSISFDKGETWTNLWYSSHTDFTRMYIDLDEFFRTSATACYNYLLRFELKSQKEEKQLCLKGFYLRSTLQMARLALPGVSLGANSFIYSDESPGERKVRITHAWRECDTAEVPRAPKDAIYPPDGGKSDGTIITFHWEPPSADSIVADYEFQLSEYPDMRWPLSPNFHVLVGRTKDYSTATYELRNPGLVNPDQSYYWRVRARSLQGIWGHWSNIFSFTVDAPAVPVEVKAQFEKDTRTAGLSWQPGQGGFSPVRYRIYGSNERGFTVSDVPYILNAGIDGSRSCPPNLLYETDGPITSWKSVPPRLWRPYYRVMAVDGQGRVSGPSDITELTHPLIVSVDLPEGQTDSYYDAKVCLSASIGHLVSASENGNAYQMRLRSGDKPVFEMAGAPAGLEIDPNTGAIAGFLAEDSAGKYEVTLTVKGVGMNVRDSRKLLLRVRGR